MFKQLDEQFEDPDQKEFELTMSKTILAMPKEVQDRFKALKNLYVSYRFHHVRDFSPSSRTELGARKGFPWLCMHRSDAPELASL